MPVAPGSAREIEIGRVHDVADGKRAIAAYHQEGRWAYLYARRRCPEAERGHERQPPGDRIRWERRLWTVTEVLYAELLGTPVGPFYRCHRWTRRGGARVRVSGLVGAGGTQVVGRAR